MISCTKSDRTGIPSDESFGLVADDLVEAVASAESKSRAEGTRTEDIWQYDNAIDQWRRISQLVRPVSSAFWEPARLADCWKFADHR